MISHLVEAVTQPGRSEDFCRALHVDPSVWNAQRGFIDQIITCDANLDRVLALTFWRSREDAECYHRELFARIGALQDSLLAQTANLWMTAVVISTNRTIVPEETIWTESPEQRVGIPVDNFATQALKLPAAMVVSGMEVMLEFSRGAQNMYYAAVSGMQDLARTASKNAASTFENSRRTQEQSKAETDIVRDTMSAVIAFIVPGPDAYSIAQGENSVEPGGLAAGILDPLISVLNAAQPTAPNGPPPAMALANVLNQIAQKVNNSAAGPFVSPFARLSFAEKAKVFQAIEGNGQTRPLAAIFSLVAFMAYAETGVFNRQQRTIQGRPLGWDLCRYAGVADGRDELKGYLRNIRSVETNPMYWSR